jgi:hypothetical protein
MQTIKITHVEPDDFLGPMIEATASAGAFRAEQVLHTDLDPDDQARNFAAFCAARWWNRKLSGFGSLDEDSWVATLEGSLEGLDG